MFFEVAIKRLCLSPRDIAHVNVKTSYQHPRQTCFCFQCIPGILYCMSKLVGCFYAHCLNNTFLFVVIC